MRATMADTAQDQTQPPLPGTTASTGAPSVPATTGPDVAALQRDHAAALKAAEKATRELETLKKKIGEPDFIKEQLATVLGLDKKADPIKEAEALKAAVAEASNQAQSWRGKARSMALKLASADALDAAKVDPRYRAKALVLLESSGLSALDLDEDALSVKDAASLAKLVESVKADVPVFFGSAEPQKPADGKTGFTQTNMGPPFRTGAPPPAPSDGGAPSINPVDIFQSDPLAVLGIGSNAIPIAQIRALNKQ
jgi:hypothetical protein